MRKIQKRTRWVVVIALMFVCVVAISCHNETTHAALPKKINNESTFSQKGTIREMNIVAEQPEFPEGEGKKEFVAYCNICHSLRYITIQPVFPRAIWEEEVTKMVVKYHAPIDSVTAKKIVDYIVHIKTK